MTDTRNRIISLISRPPSKRSEQDIVEIIPWLSKQSSVFSTASKEVMLDILRNCEFRKCQRDDVIIWQGERGEEFYVMLSGRTSIFIDPTKSGEVTLPSAEEEFRAGDGANASSAVAAGAAATAGGGGSRADPAPQPRALSGAEKVRQLLLQLDQEAKDRQRQRQQPDDGGDGDAESGGKKPAEFDRKVLGNFIFQLEAGKCFGEIALMTEESVRNASIIADEETDLLVVSRELFNRAFKSQQEKEYAERHGFIDTSHLFNWWTPRFKRLLEMSLRKERFDYDSVIVQQGQPFSALYFIIRGVVSVSVDISQHKKQYPLQFATWKPKTELELLVRRKRKAFEQKSLQLEAIRVRRAKGYSEAERLASARHRHLAFVEEGDCVGDLEYCMGLGTHCCSHRAMGEVETLILDLQNIDRLITRRNQRTVDLLKLLVLEKTRLRLQQLELLEATSPGGGGTSAASPAAADAALFAMAAGRLQQEAEARELVRQRQQQLAQHRHQTAQEREAAALTRLFLLDKAQLIRPCVPGSLAVKLLSHSQSQYWTRRLREKEEHSMEMQERVARRDFHVQARSLRQLTSYRRADAEPDDEVKMHRELQKTVTAKQKDIVNEILESTTVRNASGEKISLMVMLKMMQRLKEVRRRLSLKSASAGSQQQSQARASLRGTSGSAKPLQRPLSSGSAASGQSAFDEETSDATLLGLEDRIGDFLRRCCTIQASQDQGGKPALLEPEASLQTRTASARSDGVTRLRRYDLDPEKVPLPGGTVLVKRKPCTGQMDRNHQHTRHYVLPNNALRILQAHSAVKMQRDSAPAPQLPQGLPQPRGSVSAGAGRGRQRPSLRGNRL